MGKGIAMTLDEIRRNAELVAADVQLNWEELNNPQSAEYFTTTLDNGVKMIPILEELYTKLINGTSVVTPDEPTKLPYTDVENYTELVAEELHAAYLIREVRDTFERVNSIIALSGSTY